jgi:hypothetical protein
MLDWATVELSTRWRLDGWNCRRSTRTTPCGLWLLSHAKSKAVGPSVTVVRRLLPAHGSRHWNAQQSSSVGRIDILFGAGIFTDSLSAMLKVHSLSSVAAGLWVLMGLIFFAAFAFGFVLAIVQLWRGQLFDWFRLWKVSVQVGPLDVFLPTTPTMQREANLFTEALLALVCLAATASFLR